MGNIVRERVEGIGVYDGIEKIVLVNCSTGDQVFTEIAVPETVTIPAAKPNMEELLSVMVDAKILSVRVIDTPVGCSAEGQHLTGKKLSIELELQQKVQYIADEPTQSVHAAHFNKLVNSILIVAPEKINCVPIETLLMQGKVVVTPYIEDIYGEKIDKRTIFKNITLLIVVKFVNC
jgi:hypothetical protein